MLTSLLNVPECDFPVLQCYHTAEPSIPASGRGNGEAHQARHSCGCSRTQGRPSCRLLPSEAAQVPRQSMTFQKSRHCSLQGPSCSSRGSSFLQLCRWKGAGFPSSLPARVPDPPPHVSSLTCVLGPLPAGRDPALGPTAVRQVHSSLPAGPGRAQPPARPRSPAEQPPLALKFKGFTALQGTFKALCVVFTHLESLLCVSRYLSAREELNVCELPHKHFHT